MPVAPSSSFPLNVVNGASINPRGDWVTLTAYAILNAVSYDGTSYLCFATRSATATTPDNDTSHWSVLAAGAPALSIVVLADNDASLSGSADGKLHNSKNFTDPWTVTLPAALAGRRVGFDQGNAEIIRVIAADGDALSVAGNIVDAFVSGEQDSTLWVVSPEDGLWVRDGQPGPGWSYEV